MDRAVDAAREAFDRGPWPRMSHAERAGYLRAIGEGLRGKAAEAGQIWPRESGALFAIAQYIAPRHGRRLRLLRRPRRHVPFEEPAKPTMGGDYGLLVREPVGVVGAIIPWNAPISLISYKIAPALIAGCTVVLKSSPEAPGAAYLFAEIAEDIGLPPGVLNVVTADREVSELLVRNPGVDKITFTGSTAAGGGSLRCAASGSPAALSSSAASPPPSSSTTWTSEAAAGAISGAECFLTGQVCSSLTRLIVTRTATTSSSTPWPARSRRSGSATRSTRTTQMGPLAMSRQRDRVEGYIAKGIDEGATLVTGGGRPKDLDRGYYIEPTVFANVDNHSTIAQEEIFGPVLSVIPADDEDHAIAIANDTIYGLNASVFTNDVDRARQVAGQLRSGTVGHNAFRTDFGMAFGGFKQSGIGREGGVEGLLPFLETKTVILNGEPTQSS